jgi:hypothetical protein
MTTYYCTKADIKSYLEMPSDSTKKDGLMDLLIPAAHAFIDEYCNRSFLLQDVIQYFNGPLGTLLLKVTPVVIDGQHTFKIWEDINRVFGDDTLVDSDDYYVDQDTGIVYFYYQVDYPRGYGPGSIKVSYSGGTVAVPPIVNIICIEMVARKLKEGPSGGLDVSSKTLPSGGTVMFQVADLLPQTKVALDALRYSP